MKQYIFVTALLCLVAQSVYAQTAPSIVFSEIMYDIPGSDEKREWVEVYNFGTEPVPIISGTSSSSWRFFDGSLHTLRSVQGSEVLESQQCAVFASDADAWLSEHPGFNGALYDTVMSLGNASSEIGLSLTRDGEVFGRVHYDSSWGGNGTGYSLERRNVASMDETQLNWTEGSESGGTPGFWIVPQPHATSSATSTPDTESDQSNSSASSSQSGSSVREAPPIAAFSFTSARGLHAGSVITFQAEAGGTKGKYAYHWDFGDGGTSNRQKINHTFKEPGEYRIVLTVENSVYQPSYSMQTITISPRQQEVTKIDVPTAVYYSDDIHITELLPDPVGSDTAEWIELENVTTTPVDLFGWRLDDEEGGSKAYTFATSTIILPGAYLVVPKEQSKLALNNTRDSVRLFSPKDELFQSVSYENSVEGKSYGFNDVDQEWVWTDPTPGYPFVSATTTQVLGESVKALDSFDEIASLADDDLISLKGIVIVPPQAVSKQKIFISDFAADSENLLEVVQRSGHFPLLQQGDEIVIDGRIDLGKTKPSIIVSSAEDMHVIDHASIPVPDVMDIAEIGVDNDFSYVMIQGKIKRVNKQSLTLTDGTATLSIKITRDIRIADLNVKKDDAVYVSGFLRYSTSASTLYLLNKEDIQKVDALDEFDEGSATSTAAHVVASTTRSFDQTPAVYYMYSAVLPLFAGIWWAAKKIKLIK